MLLLVLSLSVATSTCAPDSTDADRKASACRLTGGKPYVQDFAYCTTKPGSCRWGRIYKACIR